MIRTHGGRRHARSRTSGGTRSRPAHRRSRLPRTRSTASGARSRWAEAAVAVDELANGLLALGVAEGRRVRDPRPHEPRVGAVRLRARARRRRRRADLREQLARATSHYVLEHSEAVGVLVEDDEQRAKVDGLRRARALVRGARRRCASAAARSPPSIPGALDERADSIDEDDLFTFIYTSGTTGPPKACMIRHRNYYAMVQKSDEMEERLTLPGDVMLLYLPLAHNYGRLLHLSAAYIGFTIAFLPDPLRAAHGAAARPPDAVPERAARLREDPHRRRRRLRGAAPACERSIVDWALARRPARLAAAAGEAAGAARRSRCSTALADRLVYSKVKERLGGRLRVANAGGAPLSREIAEFFHSIDILILEGYGLSEVTTAATVNRARTSGSARSASRCRASRSGSPRTARSCSARTPCSPATTTTRRRRARRSTRRASCTRATSATSTRTASSSSPTARRTSSSPPAARTSRRRTSRTS